MKKIFIIALSALIPASAIAHEPEVVGAKIEKVGMLWNIHITIRHDDTGWDHYADGWEILDEQGKSIGFRTLADPRVEEQPFTRSLSGVVIPDGASEIFVVPRCSVHGWNDAPVRIKLKP